METLENHYRDLCDIEFTIERNKLWMLQTRVGKRTAGAAFRIATQLVDQGLIDLDEALQRVTGDQLAQLMFPRFDESAATRQIAKGMNASPGAAVGKAVFDSYTAVKWSRSGEKVILVRRETNPDDLEGMIAAQGILTSRGGKTSHAAVVARGMGKTCVCGAEQLDVDTKGRQMTVGGEVIKEGDVLSIDGTSGKVYLGEMPVMASPVVEYFEGNLDPDDLDESDTHTDLVKAVHRLMQHADAARRLGVRANSDTPEDSERARRFGAEGIGLCRTEHMFLGDRAQARRAADPGRRRQGARGGAGRRCSRCSARTSSASSRRWTACRSRCGCWTRRCTSSCRTSPSSRCGWPSPSHAARTTRTSCGCCRRCIGCTSRTRCSGCAASGWASSSRGCSPCRCGRSSRPRPSARRPAATPGSRS